MDGSALIAIWAAGLRDGEPGDPAVTPRRLGAIADRARCGGRIDDVIRGATTITTGLWVLAQLVAAGVVSIDGDGIVAPTGPPPAGAIVEPGLVDPRGADGVIDWDQMAAILADRAYGPNRDWHQSFDTFASLRRRLAALEFYGDLSGRRILQLGDDELFGLALGLVPDVASVHVVDADPRLLKHIDTEAADRGLPVTTERVDVLRDTVSATGIHTFYVSGLKDAGGLLLFITSALATTAGAGSVGYISFDPDVYRPGLSDRDVVRDLTRTLERLDCVVTGHFPGEDLLLDDTLLATLGEVTTGVAGPTVTPAAVADRLSALTADPQADLLVRKDGFPAIALRPAGVLRVETGPDSVRLAARTRDFLQRSSRGR